MANVYYGKFIDFFKRHNMYDEDMFNYLRMNSFGFDYRDEDYGDFIGCFFDCNNGILKKIRLGTPFIVDDITLLINIHEYVHGIILYKMLGKKLKLGIDWEVLPMLYEKIYMLENHTDELVQYEKMLDKRINEDSNVEYKIGLAIRDDLIQMYNNGKNFEQLDKVSKRLSRKVVRNKNLLNV